MIVNVTKVGATKWPNHIDALPWCVASFLIILIRTAFPIVAANIMKQIKFAANENSSSLYISVLKILLPEIVAVA